MFEMTLPFEKESVGVPEISFINTNCVLNLYHTFLTQLVIHANLCEVVSKGQKNVYINMYI